MRSRRWFAGRKRQILVLGGLLYLALWAWTWLWGCSDARAELVGMHQWYGRIPLLPATCAQSDLVASGVSAANRPRNWWFVGRAVSPAPFVVFVGHATEGPGSGYGAMRWYVWFGGYLCDVREVILWRTDEARSTVKDWPDADF